MSEVKTLLCDFKGTQCQKRVEKPKGGTPQSDAWVVLRGSDSRIDLCPSCVGHVKRQLTDQTKRVGRVKVKA